MNKEPSYSALMLYVINLMTIVICFATFYFLNDIGTSQVDTLSKIDYTEQKIRDIEDPEKLQQIALLLNQYLRGEEERFRFIYRFIIPCTFLSLIAAALNSGIWSYFIRTKKEPSWINRKALSFVLIHTAIVLAAMIYFGNSSLNEIDLVDAGKPVNPPENPKNQLDD